MPLLTDSLIGDTSHLSAAEFGAYMRILVAMWRAGGSLPDDDARLARIAGMTPKQWASAAHVVRVLLSPCDAGITQKRLLKEWLRVAEKSRKASSAAQARWLKNIKRTDADAYANAMRTQCNPYPNPKKEERDIPPPPVPMSAREPVVVVAEDQSIKASDDVAAALGADPSKHPAWATGALVVARWLAAGVPLSTILAAARAERIRRDGKGLGPPNGPAYLEQAVMRLHADAQRPMPPADVRAASVTPIRPDLSDAIREALENGK